MKIHNARKHKSYKCDKCDDEFYDDNDLKEHIERKHIHDEQLDQPMMDDARNFQKLLEEKILKDICKGFEDNICQSFDNNFAKLKKNLHN